MDFYGKVAWLAGLTCEVSVQAPLGFGYAQPAIPCRKEMPYCWCSTACLEMELKEGVAPMRGIILPIFQTYSRPYDETKVKRHDSRNCCLLKAYIFALLPSKRQRK